VWSCGRVGREGLKPALKRVEHNLAYEFAWIVITNCACYALPATGPYLVSCTVAGTSAILSRCGVKQTDKVVTIIVLEDYDTLIHVSGVLIMFRIAR